MTIPDFPLDEYLEKQKARVEATLLELIPAKDLYPVRLHEAMHYSLFSGGKRLRPILVMAAATALEGKEDVVIRPACALECIHAYSLIHDDLPALDDDDLRHGIATCHKEYDESTAILAGSALLTTAFEILSSFPEGNAHSLSRTQALHIVAQAIGSDGMIGGQFIDLAAAGEEFTEEEITYIHLHKTGALISAALQIGAVYSGAPDTAVDILKSVGMKIGLAFQIADDILNVEGDAELLGKATGSDEELQKATYPSLFGLDASKEKARELVTEAIDTLSVWGDTTIPLRALANFIVTRNF